MGLVYLYDEVGLPDLVSTFEYPSHPCCSFVFIFDFIAMLHVYERIPQAGSVYKIRALP